MCRLNTDHTKQIIKTEFHVRLGQVKAKSYKNGASKKTKANTTGEKYNDSYQELNYNQAQILRWQI